MVIQRCMLMTTDPGDLVIDPTCGSGTTAYTAEKWGRRWITVDTSRVALTLARIRMMGGQFPYYIPCDSELGLRIESQRSGKAPSPKHLEVVGRETHQPDLRKGFVYDRYLMSHLSPLQIILKLIKFGIRILKNRRYSL